MIELVNVSKTIKKKIVLDNINYTFKSGTVYGLYGTNGSGKTMLLRMISGLIKPTEGKVIYNGKILHKDISNLPDTGIVIENMQLIPYYTAYQNLSLLARIKNVSGKTEIIEALKRVGLKDEADVKIKKYSLGMKQRLNIAQAFFEKQNVILLDEPTNALDSDGVKLIYDVIHEEKERGALIVIATHHKEDLLEMCDIILKIENGHLCFDVGESL